jgi:thiosulfate/3-mercaptopyruvate sulfurtransferase
MSLFGEKGIHYISPEVLNSYLNSDSISIIDLQPDVHDYIVEHIPGSVYINEQHFRMYRGNLPTEYVPGHNLETIFRSAGISKNRSVVVYGGNGKFSGWGDGLEQTMGAYTLHRFGHPSIYVLDGGIESWLQAGYKVEKEFPTIEPSDFSASVNDTLFLTYSQFCELKDAPSSMVVDIRPHSVYKGDSMWSKPGHIPGAKNLPWRLLMEHDNARKVRSQSYLKELASTRNVSPEKNLILYCGTGREATAAYIVFKHVLSYPWVKIYEGSFTEWCTKTDQPTETGI